MFRIRAMRPAPKDASGLSRQNQEQSRAKAVHRLQALRTGEFADGRSGAFERGQWSGSGDTESPFASLAPFTLTALVALGLAWDTVVSDRTKRIIEDWWEDTRRLIFGNRAASAVSGQEGQDDFHRQKGDKGDLLDWMASYFVAETTAVDISGGSESARPQAGKTTTATATSTSSRRLLSPSNPWQSVWSATTAVSTAENGEMPQARFLVWTGAGSDSEIGDSDSWRVNFLAALKTLPRGSIHVSYIRKPETEASPTLLLRDCIEEAGLTEALPENIFFKSRDGLHYAFKRVIDSLKRGVADGESIAKAGIDSSPVKVPELPQPIRQKLASATLPSSSNLKAPSAKSQPTRPLLFVFDLQEEPGHARIGNRRSKASQGDEAGSRALQLAWLARELNSLGAGCLFVVGNDSRLGYLLSLDSDISQISLASDRYTPISDLETPPLHVA